MSLFKAREWWATSVDSAEEFDQGCLCVGNIDNNPDGSVKLVTGSFQGMLRIYHPTTKDYKIDDLLLEQQLEEPVLGLAAGNFSNHIDGQCLAILHPRRLSVVATSLSANGGPVEFNPLYEHPLDRPACNFTFGPFGSSRTTKDAVCVQSMDGLLSFFEQESRAFSIFLNNFLLPGPLCYNYKSDSIITVNSSVEVESYKYSELAASASPSNAGGDEDQSELTAFKKLQTSWSLSLGEHTIGMKLGRLSKSLSPGQLDLVIVSQRHLTCLKDSGQVRSQKRLDYSPSCFTLYELPDKGDGPGMRMQGLIVGTHNETVLIYHDMELKWAAQCGCIPISLSVSSFGGLDGLVCSLDELGNTKLLYMGTDPPTSAVGAGVNSHKELNYEQMDEEHRRLLGLIREATSDSRTEPRDVIVISASEPTIGADEEGMGDGQLVVQVRVNLKQSGTADIDNVSFTVTTPLGITCSQDFLQIPRLSGGSGTPIAIVTSFMATGELIPPSLTVTATASYKSATGEPRTAHCEFTLPIALVARVVATAADATFKFTLDTDQAPVHIPNLYQEMAQEIMQSDGSLPAANLIALQYITGEDVKIIASKNAGRYRVQSTSLAAMCHVTKDLVARLTKFFTANGGKVAVSFTEAVPLPEYLDIVERHHSLRCAMKAHRELLSDRAEQFRCVQKRLLVRFKERNPSPVGNLDMLLEGTYDELLALGSGYEEQQAILRRTACELSCGTQLMLLLLQYRFSLDEENMKALAAHWSPDVDDNLEQGWEERVNAALLQMLRTTMAKSGKKESSVTSQQNPGLLEDVGKLKKHISLVVDRLGKGMRPVKREEGSGAPATTGDGA